MADIELVIRIPEKEYDVIKSDHYNTFPADMKMWGMESIRNGTPLPEGHGRLIDADWLSFALHNFFSGLKRPVEVEDVQAYIDIAKTIVVSDKEE